ncbi:hypothetical protein ACVBEQ_11640 [Nakamurella sp. GG22]
MVGCKLFAVAALLAGVVTAAAGSPATAGGVRTSLPFAECANDINDFGVVVTDTHLYWWGHSRPLPAGLDRATHINNRGRIAGTQGNYAALWDGRKVVVITGAVAGDDYSFIDGLNERGDVVGASGTFGGPVHAFVHRNGKTTALRGLSDSTAATGLNDRGQIVGYSWVDDRQVSIRWDKNRRVVTLPALGDGSGDALATDINNDGVATGYSYRDNNLGGPHAVIWTAGRAVKDIDLPTSTFGVGSDINNRGVVVGSTSADRQSGFFRPRSGPLKVLTPAPAVAAGQLTAVNDVGWAVGCDFDADGNSRATLYRAGR